MTLLDLDNLASIEQRIPQLEQTYAETVGMPVYEFCCHAAHVTPKSAEERRAITVASVPVTAGGGLIGNFADIVAAIVREFAGVQSFTTKGTDVTGLQEAILAGADIVFMADDITCMAMNLHTGAQSDNSVSTGRVFAALLERAAGSVAGADALVLGMGKVGQSAFQYLESAGAKAFWHDTDPPADAELLEDAHCRDWESRTWDYIVECTTAPDIVRDEHVAEGAIVSAPGIPFGLSKDACEKARLVIHDELESGIVTMLCDVM